MYADENFAPWHDWVNCFIASAKRTIQDVTFSNYLTFFGIFFTNYLDHFLNFCLILFHTNGSFSPIFGDDVPNFSGAKSQKSGHVRKLLLFLDKILPTFLLIFPFYFLLLHTSLLFSHTDMCWFCL